jgi:serine/threonine-protein kinase
VADLLPYTTLSHYRILSKLGAGGMGEVYRARDARLDRDVAIKLLPTDFARDEDRLHRFEQEARATSALNHPNILTIYDIGSHDGSPFIVAELLEGEELRRLIQDGPLPQRKAVDYAQQIASGLAAAHSKGITHRDLKPENLLVTSDGRVKILDFGLAKLRPKQSAPTESGVATQKAITDPGVVLGTVGYMSPEQVRGLPADHCADIFSLGVVLYEMLSGRRAFSGDSAIEVMNAILKEDPPELSETNVKISPALEKIVRRCLEKRPEQRFQTASDLGFALEALLVASDSRSALRSLPPLTAQSKAAGLSRGWLIRVAALMAVLVTGITAFLIGRSWSGAVATAAVRRVTVSLATPLALGKYCPLGVGRTAIALSPDGSLLVFAGEQNGRSQLFARHLDSFEARPIAGTEGAYAPFFSPDGRSLAFFAANMLKKISLEGGQPVTVCEARTAQGGAWGPDDTIIFADAEGGRLVRVAASGGEPKPIIAPDDLPSEYWGYSSPEFLPDGDTVLLSAWRTNNPDYYRIAALSLKTGKLRTVAEGGVNPRYLSTGHLVYARGATLIAAPFDVGTATVTGPAVTLIENVRTEEWGAAQYTLARDGTLAYVSGGPAWIGQLVWADRTGAITPIAAPPHAYQQFALSPDGQRIALEISEASRDIYLYEFARGSLIRFTNAGANESPRWTPDGTQLAFWRQNGPVSELVLKSAASGLEDVLMSEMGRGPSSWSPDGSTLAFLDKAPETGLDIWMNKRGQPAAPWLKTRFREWGAAFSRDGKFVAYVSDESGQYEVYVRPASGEGAQWQVSTEGGEEPVWSKDGRELFYRNGPKWMAAEVTTETQFKAGTPRLLFEGPYLNVPGVSYDVAADGRFLMLEENYKQPPTTQLQAIINWSEEVKRRVPTGSK